MGNITVVAIGGNSIVKDNEHASLEDQYLAVTETVRHIVDLIEQGHNVVITHGNGPQVGYLLRRSDIAHEVAQMHTIPLVICGADTQGSIGYHIQQALDNEFTVRGIQQRAVSVVTQTVVSLDDPAFQNPTKPIGGFYTKEQADELEQKYPDWVLIEDAGRGYRRVVPSPQPLEILENQVIKSLVDEGYCVVGVGGGGIPVVRQSDGKITGVEAVIDKDLGASILAAEINADTLIVSTGVPKVYLNFNQPNQKALDEVHLEELKEYVQQNHFAPGSMLPKIMAVIRFLENGGKKAVITSPEHFKEAIEGKTGTHIYP